MKTTDSVLEFLEENKGRFVSGGEMAVKLGVSRNAVWKSIKQLESKGYPIDAVTNKGYRLNENNTMLSAAGIRKYIKNDKIRVEFRDSVTSTNTLVKEMAENGTEEGYVLVASEQTQGKGRLGRRFESPAGCVAYFSILLRPQLSPSDSLLITTCAAVAVAKSIEKNTGRMTSIKWVNDIYMRDRKVAGILTQAAFDTECGKLSFAVLGIGINMYYPTEEMPDEIKDIAGSVFNEKPDSETVSRIVADTINYFFEDYNSLTGKHFLFDYRSRSYLDGKNINVIKPTGVFKAQAIGIDDDFRLHVRYEDLTEEFLSTGEVSTKVTGDKN